MGRRLSWCRKLRGSDENPVWRFAPAFGNEVSGRERRANWRRLRSHLDLPKVIGRLFDPIYRVTWITLLTALLATLLAWRIVSAGVQNTAAQQFTEIQSAFISELEMSIRANVEVLRGGVALLHTRPSTTRAEFRDYLLSLGVEGRFPGLQGVGYAVMISPDSLAQFEQGMREEGFDGFLVKPAGKRDVYSAIVFLEPFDWRNKRAFGFDMFHEPVRRAAMERARDTAEPAASGAVELVQETETDVQAGFLIYLPVYETRRLPETLQERRTAIKGFVYSPFRVGNLVTALLDRDKSDLKRLARIEITAPTPPGRQDAHLLQLRRPAGGKARNRDVRHDENGRYPRHSVEHQARFHPGVRKRHRWQNSLADAGRRPAPERHGCSLGRLVRESSQRGAAV